MNYLALFANISAPAPVHSTVSIEVPKPGDQSISASAERVAEHWTLKEDEQLYQAGELFHFNWELVADTVNRLRRGKHTVQGCHQRWIFLCKMVQESQRNKEPLSACGLPMSHQAELPFSDPALEILMAKKTSKMKNYGPSLKKKASKPITLMDAFRRASKRREQLKPSTYFIKI